MSSLLPTPEPADPVEGEPGHFEHTNWVKAALKALDRGLLRRPAGPVPAGKYLGTTATDTWGPVDLNIANGVPSGAIMMWHGATAPSGWAVCDGTQGTPDLRNRFVLGAGTRAVGTRGGAETVTLTAAQSGLPSHTHTMQNANATHAHGNGTTNLQHSHSASVTSDGAHSHGLWAKQDVSVGGNGRRVTGGSQGSSPGEWDGTGGGGHGHSISVGNALGTAHQLPDTKAADALHKHTIDSVAAANAAQAHDNMPPFYVLVYIMKL